MSKTTQLVDCVRAGTHRIDGLTVYRKTMVGEWVRETCWRKDTILRASVVLMRTV